MSLERSAEQHLALLQMYLKNYLVKTFERAEQWYDLAAYFGFTELIQENTRLLRSLRFGDSDYGEQVGKVLRIIASREPDLIEYIADHMKLSDYLFREDESGYHQLYGSAGAALVTVKASTLNSMLDIDKEISRIQRALHHDPEQALGSAKELLEAALKKILAEHGETNLNDDMPKLIKRVQKKLDLDPAAVAPTTPGVDAIKRILSGASLIIHSLAELRNLYGTGHGKLRPSGIEDRHTQLAVTVAGAAAAFLIETHLSQQRSADTGPLP